MEALVLSWRTVTSPRSYSTEIITYSPDDHDAAEIRLDLGSVMLCYNRELPEWRLLIKCTGPINSDLENG
jgi:hypothetical protein